MTSGAVEKYSAPTVTTRYETLRMAALGEALPPEARGGLMLFLRRGMWTWAQTLTAPSARAEPTPGPAPRSTAPCERKAVIYVLAAMAMSIRDRRAQ
jgi:hypothetical protein